MTPRPTLRVTACPNLSEVAKSDWNALLEPDDAPLLSWEYLQGLEQTRCVGEGTDWLPLHILIHRHPDETSEDRQLVAAAPAYIKLSSHGEWVWDEEWPDLSAAFGVSYYPKLVLAVPFNPVTGGRLLTLPTLPAAERRDLRGLLLRSAQLVCSSENLSSAHVLFVRGPAFRSEQTPDLGDQLDVVSQQHFWPRRQTQYHFHNRGYRSFDDFLADLRSHRRNTIRRERRELSEAGITVQTHAGLCNDETAPPVTDGKNRGFTWAELDQMFAMYLGTSVRYTGEAPFLNQAFFRLCSERLGDQLELVLARNRDGNLIAGAWNLRGTTRRFGRYWGESVPIRFLHFEVCFYHPIERCIADGISAFEPGHGGDQKLLRGFRPTYTYSAHFFSHSNLHQVIGKYLQKESFLVDAVRGFEQQRCPLRTDDE